MPFTATTFTKLTIANRNCVKISYTEFNANWSRNVDITCLYLLTLSGKHDSHCAHFHENYVRSTTFCEEILHRISRKPGTHFSCSGRQNDVLFTSYVPILTS